MAQKANNWAGQNVVRWANAEYDRLWKQAATELDPVKRATLFIRMNDLVIEDVVVIPVVWRHTCRSEPQLTGPGAGPLGFESLESGVLVPGDLRTPTVAPTYREAS